MLRDSVAVQKSVVFQGYQQPAMTASFFCDQVPELWDVGVDRGLLPQKMRSRKPNPLVPQVVMHLHNERGLGNTEPLYRLSGEAFLRAVVLVVQGLVTEHALNVL